MSSFAEMVPDTNQCVAFMVGRDNMTRGQPFPERPVQSVIGMLSFFSVLGTLGNALVLYVYVRKKNKIASTIFIICLAATDFVTSCVIMPFTIVMESLDYTITYDALCKVYFFLITCNVPFSAFIMVAIAIDRYLCICRPHCHVLDSKRSQVVIVFLALVSSLFGVLTALFHSVYDVQALPEWTNESIARVNESLLKDIMTSDTYKDARNVSACQKQESLCESTKALLDDLLNLYIATCASYKQVTRYSGVCHANQLVFSTFFRKTYQKIYASMFLVSFVIVFLLYIIIYRSVLLHRRRRYRARQNTNLRLLRDVSVTDSQVNADNLHNGFEMTELNSERRKAMLESDSCLKEKYLLANIRTAMMLFVVTLVFVLAFLPSWLMAHNVMTFHAMVFYCYFAYNVSNPIIYAFMNPAFRRELRDLVSCYGARTIVHK
ncbi:hypothetical protein C0Q70_03999 [Pomacea canaliculata]|uniref:G-protein coupled receptors family 1 profile domain-containing protein n=1 Tax=Pomacea canaliculata TaxID=400727 RepID=A0A2T7PUA3_POMCA|nr:hypothetical protein C0Q70_03999 [Pomacea canaliculata]